MPAGGAAAEVAAALEPRTDDEQLAVGVTVHAAMALDGLERAAKEAMGAAAGGAAAAAAASVPAGTRDEL